MAADRFPFVQFEFGFRLGPADGRYLSRAAPDAPGERVVVLRTLGAPERRRLRGRRLRPVDRAEPEPVPTSRATVIDAHSFPEEDEASDWLASLRREPETLDAQIEAATRELNGLLRVQRAAAADPSVRDVRPEQALVIRVGYGSGDEVADGRFAAADEVPRERRRPGKRTAELSPQERVAAVLGGRDRLLACEELVLRARADLQAERPREAALQARIALETLLAEVPRAELGDLAGALDEDRRAVSAAASAALDGDPPQELGGAVAKAVARMERALLRRAL